MPIEIKELYIRVTVNPSPGEQAAGGKLSLPAGAGGQDPEKEAIVAECVEQVLEILQNKAER